MSAVLVGKAIVHITVELTVGNFASDTKIEDAYRVASKEALDKLLNSNRNEFRVVGTPKIVSVVVGGRE